MTTFQLPGFSRTRRAALALALLTASAYASAQPVTPAPFPSPPAVNAQQLQMPGQMQGQMPQQMPGQVPGQMPGQMQGQMPQQIPGQIPGQVPGQFGAPSPFGAPPPLLSDTAIDTTGVSGARQLQQIIRGMTRQPIRGQTSTPAGWTRTQAPTAPSVLIEHPADWRGSLVATMNYSSVGYAQGKVMSGDGRNLFEGETLNLTTPIPSAQIAQAQVDRYARQLGARSMILTDDWQDPVAGGLMIANISLRAIDTGDYIVFVIASNIPNAAMERTGYAIGSVAYKIIIGPKQTFSQLTPQIYIPMLLSTNW